MEVFLIVLLVIDILMIGVFVFFYVKFKKVLELPWEEIRESIERAQELVSRLEKLKNSSETKTKIDIKSEIKMLAREGFSSKEIAKKLGISQAEVELVLASQKNLKG